jgi:hypothetical protein
MPADSSRPTLALCGARYPSIRREPRVHTGEEDREPNETIWERDLGVSPLETVVRPSPLIWPGRHGRGLLREEGNTDYDALKDHVAKRAADIGGRSDSCSRRLCVHLMGSGRSSVVHTIPGEYSR